MRSACGGWGAARFCSWTKSTAFNKAQQDAFLPYVERGDIILIGATTENPSFEVIAALLSRSRVYALRALTVPEIVTLLKRALPVVRPAMAGDELLEQIAIYANGDARQAYNTLEAAVAASAGGELTEAALQDAIQRKVLLYDKSRRRALQPDFGAAQIGALERSRCGALLAGAHAGSRRGPDVHCAASGAHGDRRHRPGRSAGARTVASRACRRCTSSAFRKATWRWRRRRSIWRGAEIRCRLSRAGRGRKTWRRPWPNPCRCICAMRLRDHEAVGIRRRLPARAQVRGCR